MKFKVGDKVRVVNAPLGLPEGDMVGETHKVTMVDNNKIPYELSNRYWCREGDIELVVDRDVLMQKVLERNNKQPIQDRLAEELEKILTDEPHDPIKPSHYRKGEIDLYESWYRTYPFNEFRAGMQMIAERYMKRDKNDRVEDINKAMETLRRLKEYEEKEREKNG